jgi:diguanylate cyclase (GGDEF)-like protein
MAGGYNTRGVRGAGSVTFVVGGLLVAAAWIAGVADLPDAAWPVVNVLAELLAVLLVASAWRFRRSRVAIATIAIALTNFLVRGPLAVEIGGPTGAGLALIGLLLPLNMTVLVLVRDQPLPRPAPLIHSAVLLAQPWVVAILLHLVRMPPIDEAAATGWLQLLRSPQAALLAFLIAGVFTALAFAARRGTFEVSMLWVLVAAALAIIGSDRADSSTLFLTSGQLALLVGLVEDSYRLAYHDELTGLPGRRALDEALSTIDGQYVLAMVDVDHFKRFNDRYGHEVGDQALRMVADELAKVPHPARTYRYGGEEFAVVLPGRSPPEVWDMLDELRAAVEYRGFSVRSAKRPRKKPEKPVASSTPTERVTVTVSIGAAGPGPRHQKPGDVLRAADAAMYRAKRRGRNRVVVHGVRAKPKKKSGRRKKE